MSDDIVALMRTDVQECDCNFRDKKCIICITEIRAADEIEHLRKELEIYKDLYAVEAVRAVRNKKR